MSEVKDNCSERWALVLWLSMYPYTKSVISEQEIIYGSGKQTFALWKGSKELIRVIRIFSEYFLLNNNFWLLFFSIVL